MSTAEKFQPQWAELTTRFRRERRMLDGVLSQQADRKRPPNEADHLRHEANRHRSIAAQQENYIGRLEHALWVAEAEIQRLDRNNRTPTRGRPRGHDEFFSDVDHTLHLADIDQADALERVEEGLSPVTERANVVCGVEGLTVRGAVELVLRRKVEQNVRNDYPEITEVDFHRVVVERFDLDLDARIRGYERYKKGST